MYMPCHMVRQATQVRPVGLPLLPLSLPNFCLSLVLPFLLPYSIDLSSSFNQANTVVERPFQD